MLVTFENGESIHVRFPAKSDYEFLYYLTLQKTAELLSNNVEGVAFTVVYLEQTLDICDLKLVINEYRTFVNEIISSSVLAIPYCKQDEEQKGYEVVTRGESLVKNYTGYSFEEIELLSIVLYRGYLRDAFISKAETTEIGREYLQKCYELKEKKADKGSLKKFKGGLNG